MPASTLHLTFADRLLDEIPPVHCSIEEIGCYKDLVRFGAVFPDLPYYDKIHLRLVFGYFGIPLRSTPIGDELHSKGMEQLLFALERSLNEDCSAAQARLWTVSFLFGLLSHSILDANVHTSLDLLMREEKLSPRRLRTRHTRIEVYQTILYHRELLGIDLLEASDFLGLFPVISLQRLRQFFPILWPIGVKALPFFPEQRKWERLYGSFLRYQVLLGKGWIRRLYTQAELDEVRQTYYAGPSFSFVGIVNAALTQAREACMHLLKGKA